MQSLSYGCFSTGMRDDRVIRNRLAVSRAVSTIRLLQHHAAYWLQL